MARQTFQDWELVVVDDGSTDGSDEIAKRAVMADEYGRVFYARPLDGEHIGLAKTLNVGVKCASGSLIARLDADDLMATTRLEQQVQYMAEHPDVGLLGTAVMLMNERGFWEGVDVPPLTDDGIRRAMPYVNPFRHPSVVFRLDVFDRAGGYDPSFPVAQDWDLWTRMAPLTQMANLPEPLTFRRQHPEQVSARRAKARRLAEARIRWRQGNVLGAVRARLMAAVRG